MNGAMVASLTGVFTTLAGFVLVVIQLLSRQKGKLREPAARHAAAEVGPVRLGLATTFPGLVVMLIGAALIIVGVFTWR